MTSQDTHTHTHTHTHTQTHMSMNVYNGLGGGQQVCQGVSKADVTNSSFLVKMDQNQLFLVVEHIEHTLGS